MSRGSARKIDFAKQSHKNREHVSRFLFSQREKVSAWELSDVRVLQSQNTTCRKNEVFRQLSAFLAEVAEVHDRGGHAPEVGHHVRHLEDILEVAVHHDAAYTGEQGNREDARAVGFAELGAAD